jgi:hypothetical protein
MTKDGRRVCFDFNNKEKTCRMGKKCRFAHVCGKCVKEKVPMYECNCKHGA